MVSYNEKQTNILDHRESIQKRYTKLNNKIKHHILNKTQTDFIKSFNHDEYHKNMIKLAQKAKRKDIHMVLDVSEQYHFIFMDIVMGHLVKDQSKSTNNMKVIIPLELLLEDQERIDYQQLDDQLAQTMIAPLDDNLGDPTMKIDFSQDGFNHLNCRIWACLANEEIVLKQQEYSRKQL